MKDSFKSIFYLPTLLMLLALTGCNSNQKQMVKSVTLETFGNEEEHIFVKSSVVFDFEGTANFTAVEVPVKMPGQDISYGTIRLVPTLEGYNEVTLTANLTTIFKLRGGAADLPNGSQLPIGQIELIDVIQIPINGINAEVYVASRNGYILLGFAIAIKELDPLGTWIGGDANIFPGFSIKEINGNAGIFTKANVSGQTGVAAFISFKSTISPEQGNLIAQGATYNQVFNSELNMKSANAYESEAFTFTNGLPSKAKQRKFLKAFKKIKRGTRLTPANR